jgi:hypothetical protein
VSPPAGCTYTASTRVLSCTVATLSSGGSRTFTFATTVNKGGGWITNTAQVTSATQDPNVSNNSSTVRVRK